jgi:RNA-directed DNA polymerase
VPANDLDREGDIDRRPYHRRPRFSYIKDWVEKKVRRHLAQARKRGGFGWEQWSGPWLYETLRLFNSYRVRRYGVKAAPA